MSMSTSSFAPGGVCPPELVAAIASTVTTGAPFASSLAVVDTDRGSVQFPVAGPTGADWVAEGAAVPTINPGDSTITVAACKLGGIVYASSELLSDAAIDVFGLLGATIRDAMSHQLDDGLLHGDGTAPVPLGLLNPANDLASVEGGTLREACIAAWGDLVANGARPDSITAFANPTDAAIELAREAAGGPIHPDSAASGGFLLGPGVRLVPVNAMDPGEVLVADTSRVYLIRRSDFSVAISRDAVQAFERDQLAMRITGRFNVAAPAPDKSLRIAQIAS